MDLEILQAASRMLTAIAGLHSKRQPMQEACMLCEARSLLLIKSFTVVLSSRFFMHAIAVHKNKDLKAEPVPSQADALKIVSLVTTACAASCQRLDFKPLHNTERGPEQKSHWQDAIEASATM